MANFTKHSAWHSRTNAYWSRLWPVSKRVNRTGNVDDQTLIEETSLGAV